MSQSALVAEPQTSSTQMPLRAVMLAVALVSLSSLLLELALTRLFSVVLFYHFAFFAISVALLGLGSGGVFAHIRQEWLARFDMRTLGAWLCLLNTIFILIMAANYSGKIIDVIYAKGVYRDPKWIEYARWNAISRIEVSTQLGGRYVVIDADATTAIMNVDPARWEQNGSATPMYTGLPETSGFNWKKSLMSAAPSVANVLRPRGDYAIIGPGGGVDVMRAVANGSTNVTGIEINPTIANNVMRGRYADYSFHLYVQPQINIHLHDRRSYIRSSHEKYDVVQMTLVDTWASTAAGAFALSENNLYTIEAFREYFDHLKPDGMIAITRWEFKQPREALRVVSQGIEALHQVGVANPRQHFILIADGGLNEDGRPVLVLAKKTPFTAGEYAAVAAHIRDNPNLFWLNPTAEYAGLQPLPPAAADFRD